jgi:E3 ubiquitin-protein ligase UBR1
MGSELEPVKNYPFRVSVSDELQESMKRTIGYALDFILETLDVSPDEPSNPPPATEADLRAQSSGDPMMKDVYCVLIWNDDKHSFDEVIQLVLDTTNKTHDEAYIIVKNIDEQGREIVDMHNNVHRLLETAQIISQVDLGVTIRRAYDTFREQVSAVIIEWLLDLTRSRLATDALFLREMIAVELMSPRKTYTNQTPPPISDLPDYTRLDWLFLYHTRLWKKPRLSLKEIYASVLTLSHEHKLAVGKRIPIHLYFTYYSLTSAGHFANVYYRVIDAYLLVDREAETSIKYFALQLFTVPSIAYHIVKHHGVVSRLLAIITAFFTNQIVDKRISYTPNDTSEVDVESFPFKSKRFMPVFSDLRYLCHNGPVQNLIAHNREYLTQFAAVCQLFMCINPNKRAVTTHVEYETDAWISVFNVTLSLSRVIKVYGEAFSRSSPAELVVAINTVVHRILLVCTTIGGRVDKSKFPPIHFHEVSFGWADYKIVQFDVLDGWVSFHHSLHWLLAELFKHVDKLSEESLSLVGLSSVRDVILRNASEHAIQTVIDFPLRGQYLQEFSVI